MDEYKLDVRFKKQGLIKKTRSVGNKCDSISIYCKDGKLFLIKSCHTFPQNTSINIDSPYVNKGAVFYQML